MSIDEIIAQCTPYLINGKKCYEEKDVIIMLSKMIYNKNISIERKETNIEQYPEVTC